MSVIVCNKTTQIGKRINQNGYVSPGLLGKVQFGVAARRPTTLELAPQFIDAVPLRASLPYPQTRRAGCKELNTSAVGLGVGAKATTTLELAPQFIDAVPLRASLN
ncbi:hypothetical protein [Microseira wollei]|uniref:Uncharacterized protein n=1 Tax=Microseira wollei NIES-4236 TaxID=2530354 RepID=A0AAV3X8C2_9CYAN|nr:hypothetical protein [Microseira wollei]GET38075.1 hypothetical protein MiSe_28290 [Microseira wollei NIES-4236]